MKDSVLPLLVVSFVVAGCGAPRQPVRSHADYEAGQRWVEDKLQQARAGNVDSGFANFLEIQTQLKIQAGDYKSAVHTAEPLATLTEIVHGPNSLETAAALEVLAQVYCEVDRCDESPALLERAQLIRARPESGGS